MCLSWISHIYGIIQYAVFSAWHLSLSITFFKVYSNCSTYQYFVLFHSWIILYRMDIPHFVYPLISWGTFGLFLLWLLRVTLWIFMYESWCGHTLFLLDIHLRVKLPSHMVTWSLMFWGAAKLFHRDCTNLYSYQQCVRVPNFPYPCQHLLYHLFDYSHLSSVRWHSLCFWFVFSLKTNHVEHLFLCFLII